MGNIKAIYFKELRAFFNSPMAYIFLVIFALVNGYFFTNTFFLIGQSDLRTLFSTVPLVYLFFIPAVAMGLIARERNIGTIEIMSTLPLKTTEFVIGKFLAALTLILAALAVTSVHFITLLQVGDNVDTGAVISGYIGLALVGALYTSVGTFASSLTENQVVAFIIGVFIVLVFWLMDKMLIFIPSGISGLVQYFAVEYHLSNISRGVIDTRNLVYFFSIVGFFLFLTVHTLDTRKWKAG
ncbi:MAG: ABC transporter permease subunit [Candidatus Marinimicrobia bacterium]|jgi:ABC-2 type transport system permease protein|nr:ABC transporter permease subunit [Candidatus Neomarinimicrobiota bacterium]MDP6790003.1 ABC transporter permease subunit [Candidatus Neomarinimicrobiota bacterium]MDP7072104.1 ABC transporter permease subunit [Candidatus Neomarinimicrobiota bacterium]